MTDEKAMKMINECIAQFPNESQSIYKEIAEYTLSLGYKPAWIKVRQKGKSVNSASLSFSKHASGKSMTILKINPKPSLSLKFYASKVYSEIFKLGIQRVIEEFNGRYTGCYGCGKCTGELEGYTYVYSDGRKIFRCGGELIRLTKPILPEHINEMKVLLKTQDEYFVFRKS